MYEDKFWHKRVRHVFNLGLMEVSVLERIILHFLPLHSYVDEAGTVRFKTFWDRLYIYEYKLPENIPTGYIILPPSEEKSWLN